MGKLVISFFWFLNIISQIRHLEPVGPCRTLIACIRMVSFEVCNHNLLVKGCGCFNNLAVSKINSNVTRLVDHQSRNFRNRIDCSFFSCFIEESCFILIRTSLSIIWSIGWRIIMPDKALDKTYTVKDTNTIFITSDTTQTISICLVFLFFAPVN